MSLPVVYMDVVFLAGLQLVFLTIGALAGRRFWRRGGIVPSTHEPTEARELLDLMSRADHASENYITSIQGHLAVLGQELPTDEERWQVSRDAIADAANQMKRHIERLRLIRLGFDETYVQVAPVNLARLIERILITLEPAATQGDVSLRMDVQPLSSPVLGDLRMLEEIFTTLLDNAIKHNPPGTEVVAELSGRNGLALTRISDTGRGVDPELVTHVFEPRERDGQAGTPPGTGMGLHIAKMLTELHQGTINVDSKLGEGSVFTVSLPLATAER